MIENLSENSQSDMKRSWINQTGLTVIRVHMWIPLLVEAPGADRNTTVISQNISDPERMLQSAGLIHSFWLPTALSGFRYAVVETFPSRKIDAYVLLFSSIADV
jgi:hypothetical protein